MPLYRPAADAVNIGDSIDHQGVGSHRHDGEVLVTGNFQTVLVGDNVKFPYTSTRFDLDLDFIVTNHIYAYLINVCHLFLLSAGMLPKKRSVRKCVSSHCYNGYFFCGADAFFSATFFAVSSLSLARFASYAVLLTGVISFMDKIVPPLTMQTALTSSISNSLYLNFDSGRNHNFPEKPADALMIYDLPSLLIVTTP